MRLPGATRLVVGFQHKQDAERFLHDLKERLGRFELELHPDKTRLIEFGRFAIEGRRQRGLGKPETFDFLGFTHYCAKDRKGRFQLGRKPVSKRMSAYPEANKGGASQADASTSVRPDRAVAGTGT